MKTRFVKLSLVASAVIYAVNLNADSFTVNSSSGYTNGTTGGTYNNKWFRPGKTSNLAGSAGFFDAKGSNMAVQIVSGTHKYTPSWYSQAGVNLGGANDATSLQNMKAALEIIQTTNEFRTNSQYGENKGALKVSDVLMAVSQIRTDWAANYKWGHATMEGIASVAENLGNGLSTSNISAGWYSEKACVINPNSQECKNSVGRGQTGHYTNMVGNHTLTGAAYATGSKGRITGAVYSSGTIFPTSNYYDKIDFNDGIDVNLYAAMLDAYIDTGWYFYNENQVVNVTNGVNDNQVKISAGYAIDGLNATGNSLTIQSGAKFNEAHGGYSLGSGNANSNIIEVKNNANIYLIIGGQAQNGNANSNKVTLNGASATNVKGGFTTTGNANNNEITISGGNISGEIIAGQGSGSATGNKITINNNANISGTYIIGSKTNNQSAQGELNLIYVTANNADIIGAESTSGDVKGTITLGGNNVATAKNVYDGKTGSGNANENTVNLVNVDIKGDVYGGYSQSGRETNKNTINFFKGTVAGTIYGANKFGSNNVLNIGSATNKVASGLKAGNIANFNDINFYLADSVENEATILSLTGGARTVLGDTNVFVHLADVSSITAQNVDSWAVHLLNNSATITDPKGKNTSGVATVNLSGFATVDAIIALADNNTNLDLKFNATPDNPGGDQPGGDTDNQQGDNNADNDGGNSDGLTDEEKKKAEEEAKKKEIQKQRMKASQEAKSLLETRLSNVVFINAGGNIVSDNINSLPTGGTFVLSQGISQDVETGSHIEVSGLNLSAGISSKNEIGRGNLEVAAFAEYGKGKYDSYLDDGTHGKGDSRYYGGGVVAKFIANSSLYAEGSLRAGRTNYDYASDNGLLNTNDFTFDLKSTYFGAHFGLGREFYSDNNIFDLYAKYYYLRVGGTSFTQGGVGVEFDSVESHRARVGFRDSLKFGEYNSLYIGAAYEYEFSGEANGIVSHPAFGSANIASPKLKGSTGIGEIGYVFENGRLRFDIGAKGFVGRQRGYSGNIGFTFKF